jgi:hypothetical protein
VAFEAAWHLLLAALRLELGLMLARQALPLEPLCQPFPGIFCEGNLTAAPITFIIPHTGAGGPEVVRGLGDGVEWWGWA